MAKLAIKFISDVDALSKHPVIEKTFDRFCSDNNLQPHEKRLARAMLNYSVTIQQLEGETFIGAVKKAFAFITGYAGAVGVKNSDMAEIIGL